MTFDLGGPVPTGPKYQRITDELRRRIETQAPGYTPSVKLPTEQEISAEFGVSSSSTRRALQELERMLLVTPRQGSAWYVRSDWRLPVWVGTWSVRRGADDALASTPQYEITSAKKMPVPDRIAKILGIEGAHEVPIVRWRRVMYGELVELGAAYLAWDLDEAAYAEMRQLSPLDLLWFVDKNIPALCARVSEDIVPRPATSEETTALGISLCEQVVQITRVVIDEAGQVVGVWDSLHPASRIELVSELEVDE